MAQQRINIYGSLIDTADLPTMVSSLFQPGRYTGCNFEVGGGNILRVSPGSALLPDGVLIIEDESKELIIGNSSNEANYTIIYQLDDSRILGGSPATLRATAGITRQDAFTDAVVLGWIRYPGGAIPLSSSHFTQPFPLRVSPKTGTYYTSILPRFIDAIRPSSEQAGAVNTQSVDISNFAVPQSKTLSFGGQRVRILGASILSLLDLKTLVQSGTTVSDPSNYVTVELKKGSVVLYSYDTRSAPTGQGYLRAGVPGIATKKTSINPDSFIIEANETLTISINRSGIFETSYPGSIAVSYEAPASSGRWSEKVELLKNEQVVSWENVSIVPEIYKIRFPFVVAREGQPRKLVARLQVDFGCVLQISIVVQGITLKLSPGDGVVNNTGGLITREFDIPVDTRVEWVPASVASIDVEIQANAGRKASLGQLSLALEPSPYPLFTSIQS